MSEPISHDHVAFLARYAYSGKRVNRSTLRTQQLNVERLEPLIDAGLIATHPSRDGRTTYSVTDTGSQVADSMLSHLKQLLTP